MGDKAGQTGVAKVSHAALVLNPSGHRDTASPAPPKKERSILLCLFHSLSVALFFPFMAACAGIKCIPHEWIAEIRDGSQRVRCLTWIKAKSLAAPAPPAPGGASYLQLFVHSSSLSLLQTPSLSLAYWHQFSQPSMLQALVMSMSPHRCHYQFASHFNWLIFLYELSNSISSSSSPKR